jgi:hypothetical protein
MFVLDQRDAHVIVPVLSETDARRDRDVGMLDQEFGEFERAEMPEPLTPERFDKLLSAYVGAVGHTIWTASYASLDDNRLAQDAERDARASLVKAVFP